MTPPEGWYRSIAEAATTWHWAGHWSSGVATPTGSFVGYARADEIAVLEMSRDIDAARIPVWYDADLHGGEPWWTAILEKIRDSAVFIYAISDNSLESEPCRREYTYAKDLGIPILPVQVGIVSNLRTWNIGIQQLIDYRRRDIPAVAQLVRALTELRFARTPLPSQLPLPPEMPHATLVMLATRLLADQLTFAEQRSLQRGLEDELERARSDEVREDVLSLMGKLRDRPEIAARVRDDIDKLLGSREAKR